MSHYKPYPAYKDSGVEWLGEVPEHWAVIQMKSGIKSLQNGVWGDEPTGGPDDVACARVADFDRIRLIVDEPLPTLRSVPQAQRSYKNVRTGDLLLEKSGGGEQTTVGAMVQYLGTSEVVCSNFVASVKCKEGVSARWLCYANSHLYYLGVNTRSIKQTTGIQNLDSNQYSAELIAFPAYAEQQAIAAHLDHETTRIDSLIAKKTRFIELLKEKRQALITQAVTKGLNPNVKMKNSGVEWLGEVPEHWGVMQLQYVVAKIEQGWSPECLGEPAQGSEWGVVKSGCVNGGVFSSDENKKLPDSFKPRPEIAIRNGDILMSRASGSIEFIGSIGLVEKFYGNLMLSDKIFRLSLKPNIDKLFFVTLMTSRLIRNQIEMAISGAEGLANNLPQARIRKFWFALPPSEEQSLISEYVEVQTKRLEALISKSDRSITLLKARRSALITAAVTGQIDLREAA